MAAVYRKNVAFKRAKDAEFAQKKALRDLAEMRECTFKPRINKSFLARGGAPSYNMDDEVRMPVRLRHLHIPSLQTRHEGRGEQHQHGPNGHGGAGGGGDDDGLDVIAKAFAALEVDLSQRHYVVKALEKENNRLRLVSAFARADVPSAQQHLGGDFRWQHPRQSQSPQPPSHSRAGGGRGGVQLRGGRGSSSQRQGGVDRGSHSGGGGGGGSEGRPGGEDNGAGKGAYDDDEEKAEEEKEEVTQLQAEAHELVDGLADYVRHSTTYVTSLLWEFDQLSYLLEADESGAGVAGACERACVILLYCLCDFHGACVRACIRALLEFFCVSTVSTGVCARVCVVVIFMRVYGVHMRARVCVRACVGGGRAGGRAGGGGTSVLMRGGEHQFASLGCA
jgi:hypothetical protein